MRQRVGSAKALPTRAKASRRSAAAATPGARVSVVVIRSTLQSPLYQVVVKSASDPDVPTVVLLIAFVDLAGGLYLVLYALRRQRGRSEPLLAVGGILVVIAVVLGYLALRPTPSSRPPTPQTTVPPGSVTSPLDLDHRTLTRQRMPTSCARCRHGGARPRW